MNKFKQTAVPSEEKKLLDDSNNNKMEVIQMHPRKKESVEPLNRQSKSFDSFQNDVKTSDKRKKGRTYKTAEAIAGKVTEQIGSSRNMTDENEWILDSSNRKNEGSNSVELRKKIRIKDNSIDDGNFGFGNSNNKYQPKYVSGEFNSDGKRKNYEYPDPRVAQRLASYERLPSTYDNLKSTYDQKKSSSSIKNIDL